MGRTSCLVVAAVLLLATSCFAARRQLVLDREKFAHVSGALGFDTSLLEVGASTNAKAVDTTATPADIEAGDFEIKCSTNCDFVKKGVAEVSSVNRGAMLAAQDLAASQRLLKHVMDKLKVDSENEELQLQKTKLEMEIQEKTHTLQLAVGVDAPDPTIAVQSASVESAKHQLENLEQKLAQTPSDPVLQRQKHELEELVREKEEAMSAAAHVESEQATLQEEVKTLTEKLNELQDAMKKAPENGLIKEEMQKVKDELDSKSTELNTFQPKKECYRVCVNPSTHGAAEAPKGSGRRLLSTVSTKDVNNCIHVCLRVMRSLVATMGKKLL